MVIKLKVKLHDVLLLIVTAQICACYSILCWWNCDGWCPPYHDQILPQIRWSLYHDQVQEKHGEQMQDSKFRTH